MFSSKKSIFQKLLLQSGVFAMACDGDIHPDEVKLLKDMAATNAHFKKFNHEQELASCVELLQSDPKGSIVRFFADLEKRTLTEDQMKVMADLVVQVVEADDVIMEEELHYLLRLQESLKLTDQQFVALCPAHAQESIDFRDSGKRRHFADNFSKLDFSQLYNSPFMFL
jgi:uncharacterized tellurite resistance protein B-like protein